MKWYKRTICGNKYHEFRNEDHEPYKYLFNIEVTPSGRITVYDLKGKPPVRHYIGFTSLRQAKRIAVESIKDKKVFEAYIDHQDIKDSEEFVRVMANAEKLLNSLKDGE